MSHRQRAQRSAVAILSLFLCMALVPMIALAETVSDAPGDEALPDGASDLGSKIDNIGVNIALPIIGLAAFASGGLGAAFNRGNAAASAINGGLGGGVVGGLVVAAAPFLITTSREVLNAAPLDGIMHVAQAAPLYLRDPITMMTLTLAPPALVAMRRKKAAAREAHTAQID